MTHLPEETWAETKILVGRLVGRQKFKEAHDLLNDAHLGFKHPPRREGPIIGMLFILSLLFER